jgi:hypothetical protein
LSGKSGKAASGVAKPADYTWLVGDYTECIQSGVSTLNGVPQPPNDNDQNSNPFVDAPCDSTLEIVHLGGYSFQATFLREVDTGVKLKWVYHGTGSYNRAKAGNVVFASDYIYVYNGTDWVEFGDPETSDTEFMECSQLPGDDTGTSIACDFVNDVAIAPSVEYDITATVLFTDPSK